MRLRLSGYAAAFTLSALAVAGAMPSQAAPLDPSACEQLQVRLDELKRDGVEADMAMGPEAARARLPIDRFNRIGTFIELDEQLNFRCGLGKQRIALPTTVEGGEEEIPASGDTAGASTTAPPAATPTVKGAAAAADVQPKRKAQTPPKKQPKAVKGADTADGTEKPAPKAAKKAPPAKKAATKQPADAAARPKAPAQAPAKKAPAKKATPPRQPAAKIDDAYRPPPKAAAREEPGQPSARQ